jgi:hypothetical protein
MRITIDISGDMPGSAQPRLTVDASGSTGTLGKQTGEHAGAADAGEAINGGGPDPELLKALSAATGGGEVRPGDAGRGQSMPGTADGGSAPAWLVGVIEGSPTRPPGT